MKNFVRNWSGIGNRESGIGSRGKHSAIALRPSQKELASEVKSKL
ncbi:hypothetical protein [Moorena sp. SIO4G3]|nr:hypothetical protein [Moorena sp. SIO4G3]